MARKDVLKGLMTASTPPVDTPPSPQRLDRGAIGAVSRSFADLKARSVVEIDPGLIDPGGLADRLEPDADADATLRQSIADHGQQVPVLVRPHPQTPGRFQIVFGRRRVLALRDLGQLVKALIRDLSDQELVLAQGQENTARRDLSFIEKVNFSRQLQEHGYDRKVICDALSVDKTLMSRMLSLAERIPPDVIATIGAAPSIGRDRWTALADLLEKTGAPGPEIEAMINLKSQGPGSDARFQAAWAYLSSLADGSRAAARAQSQRTPILATDGQPLGEVRLDTGLCILRLDRTQAAGFETWLIKALPRLHADWVIQQLLSDQAAETTKARDSD
jgi:ParB family transcriptional regulator, chromosome partitioning protein